MATEQAVLQRLDAWITVETWRTSRQVRTCWPAAQLSPGTLCGQHTPAGPALSRVGPSAAALCLSQLMGASVWLALHTCISAFHCAQVGG